MILILGKQIRDNSFSSGGITGNRKRYHRPRVPARGDVDEPGITRKGQKQEDIWICGY